MGSTTSKFIIWGVLAPGVLAVSGNDFSNNLFSDLAPLLALFGEQVAKQFMSQSMTWLEDIIFAMAPLGIITAMISAIRVGGPNSLKAVVGRARESSAAAEVELLSSTSHEVCELWNGHTIVRVMGSPSIAEILYFEGTAQADDNTCGLYTFEEARARGVLRDLGLEPARRQSDLSTAAAAATATSGATAATGARTADTVSFELSSVVSRVRDHDPEAPLLESAGDPNAISAPNVSLNVCEIHNKRELWAFVILGTVLQFGSLVFIALARYHPKIHRIGEDRRFAFPLMATGTIFLVLGMLLCSRTVQAASQETTWGVTTGAFRVLWLQKSDVVNDQVFDSYAIFAKGPRAKLITSRRRTAETSRIPKPTWIQWSIWLFSSERLAALGALTSLTGFVSQFVGLRSLDWTASISQLVIILMMTAARTWIRRNMSARPRAERVPRGNEIDWLATQLGTSTANLWNPQEPRDPPANTSNGDSCDGREWKVAPQTSYLSYEEVIEKAPRNMKAAWKIVRIRERLGYLTKWPGRSYRTASNLSICIQRILNYITTTNSITRIGSFPEYALQWALPVKVGREDQYTILTAQRRRDELGNWLGWSVPVSELDAVLSLWLFAIERKEKRDHIANRENNTSDHINWLQELQFIGGNSKVLRVLGKASDDFRRECRWWMERDGRFVLVRPVGTCGSTCTTQELSRNNLQASSGAGGGPTVFEASHRIVGLKAREDGSLGIISEMPLESMCAQEILSAFLWVIAGVVESITGKTSPREAEPGDHESNLEEWFDFKRENVFLEGLAEIIHSSGVATVQEAYALFIPALETKLPGKSYIVTECRQRIRRLQATEGWGSTAKAKDALFELSKICRGHPTAVTVTAMLTEELCSLHSLETIWRHRSYDTDVHKVADHVGSINDKLRDEAEELTLAALKYLYEKQGRGSGGPDCLPEGCLDIFPGIPPGSEEEIQQKANWTPAHQHFVDRKRDNNHFDVNAADILGWTPLHYIANKSGDHIRSFSRIVSAGGHLDARTMLDYTPLHLAASQGNFEIVKKLLDLGADKEAMNADQRTPFHLAAEGGHQKIVKILKSKDANPKARDKFGWTPLHFAAFGAKLEIAKELLNAGASPDAREGMEMTPLHLAAHNNESAVIGLLLGHADLFHSPKDSFGRRPIHLAAKHGSYEAAHRLWETGADLNKPDRKNRAPLYLAVRGGHRSLVVLLLEKGAHFTHRQKIKDMAKALGHAEILTVLGRYPT